ncbi:MAG TPA: hypothetical protein VIF09_27505 [Polyangiaceae bacterium]|jgi:hypothetical protein
MRPSSLVVLGSFPLLACGAPPSGAGVEAAQGDALSAEAATSYVDIADYWKTGADQTAWQAAVANVRLQFDQICGDTFCDGDYANFEPLELQCGVSSVRGSVKACTWVFAASEAIVNAKTGTVHTSAPYYACAFDPKGTAKQLAAALGATGSLQAPLPGLTQSLYDVVGECLQHPIGATPLGAPAAGAYEDASDADGVDQGAWFAMTGALAQSFDRVCGDTFCEGDYANLSSFGFTCSIGTKSKKIRECRWVFDGSHSSVVAKTGAVTVNEKAWVCAVPVKGTAQDLMNVLGAAGAVEPVQRTLPGETTSVYDALVKCLP